MHRSVQIVSQVGVRPRQELTVEWECPGCRRPFEQTASMDLDQVDEFGFESWVGSFEGEPVCLIMEDGGNVVGSAEQSTGSTAGKRGVPEEGEDSRVGQH